MPQFALPSPSFLYPPSLLYAIQTYSQGLSTQQIIHHVAAAIGGALLAESLGLGFAASACAGMAFAFSGYMFSLSANYSLVAGVSWLPLALFSSRRIRFAATRAQRSFWTIMLSIFVFLMVSAGRPEVFVPVIVIVFAHALAGIGRHYLLKYGKNWKNKADSETTDPANTLDTNHPVRVFFCRITALAIGGCLCMPLLLPALEWASTSSRAKGLATSEVMMWSANWYSFATMFLVQPFGDLQLLGNGFLPFAADRASYFAISAVCILRNCSAYTCTSGNLSHTVTMAGAGSSTVDCRHHFFTWAFHPGLAFSGQPSQYAFGLALSSQVACFADYGTLSFSCIRYSGGEG